MAWLRTALAALGMAAALAMTSALGAAVAAPSPEDRDGVQATITAQMDALQRDDGLTAYSFAADAIKGMFPTPDVFLDMVRKGYPPVYRPKTRVFGAFEETPGGVAQEVLISDQEGVAWVARYTLSRDAEGRWRITGCQLTKSEGFSI